MEHKLNMINKFLISLVLIAFLAILIEIGYWFPGVAQSTKRLNIAKCLESYNLQGQPPLGACGFDFE